MHTDLRGRGFAGRTLSSWAAIAALAVIGGTAAAGEPGKAQAAAAPSVCVQVRIGAGKSSDFRCLNAALGALAVRINERRAVLGNVAASATSLAPTQVGLVNVSAVHERLGTAFGHSAFPQRPTQVPVVPLLHQGRFP